MRVLLLQLDGAMPNLALLRIAAAHRRTDDAVEYRIAPTVRAVEPGLWDSFDRVYGSAIFEKSRPIAERLLAVRPDAIIGGTGWNVALTLEDLGFHPDIPPDYTVVPNYPHSIGFTQRGCRLRCPFCLVPAKEGAVREAATISDIWRGDPWPRNVLLLDNDFFGQPNWRARVDELNDGGFRVCLTQGINARLLTDETAAALASLQYYDGTFRARRLYTAWDSQKDEKRLFRGLESLVKHGVKPDHIMVYILIGYWPGETVEGWEYRRARLRAFGARPYPMPYRRTAEAVGFQRFVTGAYDKRISWAAWQRAGYRPENLGAPTAPKLWEDASHAQ